MVHLSKYPNRFGIHGSRLPKALLGTKNVGSSTLLFTLSGLLPGCRVAFRGVPGRPPKRDAASGEATARPRPEVWQGGGPGGRVAPGGCPPGAPTDPYVRALAHTVPRVMDLLCRVHGMNHPGRGKGVQFKQTVKPFPGQRPPAVSARQPFSPDVEDGVPEG